MKIYILIPFIMIATAALVYLISDFREQQNNYRQACISVCLESQAKIIDGVCYCETSNGFIKPINPRE